MATGGYDWIADMRASQGSSSLATGQSELLPLTLTDIRPGVPPGQHIAFIGAVGSDVYYCKSDQNGILVCATDWFFSSLAAHLGVPVPDFTQIVNPETGEIFFGSKESWGTADRFAVETLLLSQPIIDPAIGDPYPWLGSYLSRLYALDLFAGNSDRQLSNFLLVQRGGTQRLLAMDFASSQLIPEPTTRFDIARSQTLFVGRQLRKRRKFDESGAFELLARIQAVPFSEVEAIITSIPPEWLSEDQRGRIYDYWSNGGVAARIKALRSGLSDESLL